MPDSISRRGRESDSDGRAGSRAVSTNILHFSARVVVTPGGPSQAADDIAALERHEIKMPRVEPVYSEHRYCRAEDLFGHGHPPDTVVACALAYHAFRTCRAPGDYGITF